MANIDWASDSDSEREIDNITPQPTDVPRELTADEIENIVEGMRFALKHNPIQENIIHIHREKTRRKLRTIKIKSSKVPELKKIILRQFYSSVVAPGEAVGVNAAQNIGEPTTQLTLNSVAPYERLIIQSKDGTTHLVEIGEWIDKLLIERMAEVKHIETNRTEYLELADGVWTPSPDKDGNFGWELITAVTRHLPVGELVKITTKSGRAVTVTKSKSLLVWKDSELVQVGGGDVKLGDLVPVICQFPMPKIISEYVELRKYLSPTEWVYGTELLTVYKDWLADKRSKRMGFWTRERMANLPYARGDAVIEAARLNVIEEGYIYPKKNITAVKSRIPERMMLDLEFGRIVGLYLAEGWATDTFVGISNNDPTIMALIETWCTKYCITYLTSNQRFENSKSTDIKIHSVLLARWFKKWLGTGSQNKFIPTEAFTSSLDFARGVLDGYFAGDGTVNKRDGYLVVSSASKDLITGFGVLCSRFGVMGKQSGHQPLKNNVNSQNIKYVNTYSIRNDFAIRWATIISSCHPEKASLMQTVIIPTGRYWTKCNSMILDPITSIEEVPATHFVYDLTVPSTTNFSIWNGLGVADTFHSAGISAKNVTLGFPRARELFNATKSPSSPTCTIYFTRDNDTPDALHKLIDKFPEATIDSLIKDWKIYEPEDYDLEYWHTAWFKLHPNFGDITEDDWCLRLNFNVGKLYEKDITVKEIAARLEESYADLRCIPSPLNMGIVDVLVNCCEIHITGARSAELTEIEDDYTACKFYMNKIVSPKLRGQVICGIYGITGLYRRKAKIDDSFGGFPLKKEIKARLDHDEEWIVDTDGTNMSEIITQSGVDSYRTMSNDMWEIYSLLGIEAVRMYLFLEFMNIVKSGGISINTVHIQVLVDKMCYTGGIRSIARFGVETSQYDPIARATFEEVMTQIITSAMFSEVDHLNGISSNIVLGTKINAGTGRVQFEDIPLRVLRPPMHKSDTDSSPTPPTFVSEDI